MDDDGYDGYDRYDDLHVFQSAVVAAAFEGSCGNDWLHCPGASKAYFAHLVHLSRCCSP